MRRSIDSLLILSVLLAAASPSFAQNFGQITGRVSDASGGVLVGASSRSRIRRPACRLPSRPTAPGFMCFRICSRASTT